MGSDLHMSPPTPDEHRIVRHDNLTAVYSRHTDGIYRGGTQTWFRKHRWEDPEGTAFVTLRQTHPSWRVVTLASGKHVAGAALPPEVPYEYLATPDPDWEGEEKRLKAAHAYALRDLTRARLAVEAKERELDEFLDRKRAAGA